MGKTFAATGTRAGLERAAPATASGPPDRGRQVRLERLKLMDGERESSPWALMERVREGDVEAFEVVVETFWRRTLKYVWHLCKDDDLAYDVTQEAFSRLWQRRGEWTGSGSVRVWLLRTARNLVISDERRLQVRAKRALEISLEYPSVRTPLQDTEERELKRAVNRALRRLSPRRMEAFTLYHLQGLSYREIAAVMGLRPQTVANHIQAALLELRTHLAKHLQAFVDEEAAGEAGREAGRETRGPTPASPGMRPGGAED